MTKQLTLLLLLPFLFSPVLNGQQRQFEPQTLGATSANNLLTIPSLEVRGAVDTLYPDAINDVCWDMQVLYTAAQGWGYVSGTNFLGDKEKGQLIRNTTNTAVTVNETWAFFGHVGEVGNGNVRMKVYSVDPQTGTPANLLGQSSDVRIKDIQHQDGQFLPTSFSFNTSMTVDDPSFIIAVDFSGLYTTFDTIAIFHTELGCGSGREAYELWEDNRWSTIFDGWFGTIGLDINLSLFAIIEFAGPSDVADPYYQEGLLRLYPAVPNPARQSVRLNYELERAGPVVIEVYSADGRILQHQKLGQRSTGRHSETIDLAAFSPGGYVYAIVTDQTRIMSRFIVAGADGK